MKTDGGPAFPSGEYVEGRREDGTPVKLARYPGMTLRQWYAGMAMQGDWSDGSEGAWANNVDQDTLEKRAALYYRMAAAMLSQEADE